MIKIDQALILCGGKGERLQPITKKIPKPLVEINNETILSYQLKFLKKQGIKNFIIATGYKSQLIKEYLDKNFKSYNIKVYNSGNVNIMKRIIDVKALLNDKFLLCYGDTLANIDLKLLSKFHFNHKGSATMSIYQLQSQFGIVKTNHDDLAIEFQEKPKLDAWINIGYFILEKSLINNENSFENFIIKLSVNKYLYCYKHNDLHITVNTIKELEDAKQDIKNFNLDL